MKHSKIKTLVEDSVRSSFSVQEAMFGVMARMKRDCDGRGAFQSREEWIDNIVACVPSVLWSSSGKYNLTKEEMQEFKRRLMS